MWTSKFLLAGLLAASLAGCGQTDSERALSGAVIGAVAADVLDQNVVAGAAVGALVGTYCDELNVPGCIKR